MQNSETHRSHWQGDESNFDPEKSTFCPLEQIFMIEHYPCDKLRCLSSVVRGTIKHAIMKTCRKNLQSGRNDGDRAALMWLD